jgi:hypothetical protein
MNGRAIAYGVRRLKGLGSCVLVSTPCTVGAGAGDVVGEGRVEKRGYSLSPPSRKTCVEKLGLKILFNFFWLRNSG